jgi:hypothetical protein
MATQRTVIYTCDLPRHEKPVEATHKNVPIRFGNKVVEADLCDPCHKELAGAFEQLLNLGRKVLISAGPRRRTGQKVSSPSVTVAPTSPQPTSNGSAPSPNGRRKGAKRKVTTVIPPSQSTIRAWAQSNGVPVSSRGAVKKDVVEKFMAAH